MNVHRNYYQMQLEKHPLAPKEVEVSDRQLSRSVGSGQYRVVMCWCLGIEHKFAVDMAAATSMITAPTQVDLDTFIWPKSCVASGEFENGELNGKGIRGRVQERSDAWTRRLHCRRVSERALLAFSSTACCSGHRFEGSYREGKRDGHGVVVYANGNICLHLLPYSSYSSSTDELGGRHPLRRGSQRFESERTRQVLLSQCAGDVYEGDLEDNLPHGEGTYRFASGTVYEGQFRAGRIHGEGKFEFPEDAGERLESEFEGLRVCAVSVRRSGVSSSWSEYPREAQDPGQLATCCRLARLMSMQGGQIPGQFSNGKFVQPSLVEVEEAVENTDAQDSQAVSERESVPPIDEEAGRRRRESGGSYCGLQPSSERRYESLLLFRDTI
eukprot:768754-Hanusia_phi.AAC.2